MGTAGARFMVAKQLAASGGLYLEDDGTRFAMDPGPGAVVQYAKRKVDLTHLDGILLSHRHLDHCGDVNVMIEAMTEGGFRPRGKLYCPGPEPPPDGGDSGPGRPSFRRSGFRAYSVGTETIGSSNFTPARRRPTART